MERFAGGLSAGAEMVRTDCRWGPESGIIVGSDVPFAGPSPVLLECTISSGADMEHQAGELGRPLCFTAGETGRGEGACP